MGIQYVIFPVFFVLFLLSCFLILKAMGANAEYLKHLWIGKDVMVGWGGLKQILMIWSKGSNGMKKGDKWFQILKEYTISNTSEHFHLWLGVLTEIQAQRFLWH
jgi:hypothetical protein